MNLHSALLMISPVAMATFVAGACSVPGADVRLGANPNTRAGVGGNADEAGGGSQSGGAGARMDGGGGLSVDPDPNTICPDGQETTVSGIVYDPAGNLPLYNAVVYVPSAAGALPAFPPGVACELCKDPVPAKTVALSGADGRFLLKDVPAGRVDLVVQLGKWRRKQTVSVKPCQDNALTDKNLTRLPRTQLEGDIPKIALSTGHSDALECLLRKIGIDDAEFTTDEGGGRVSMFVGCEGDDGKNFGANKFVDGTLFPSTNQLFDSGKLHDYDVVIFSCEGHKCDSIQTAENAAKLVEFENKGGRVFLDHDHYNWPKNSDAPIESVANWDHGGDIADSPLTTQINVTFPKGEAFAQWLYLEEVGASHKLGELDIYAAKSSVSELSSKRAQKWIYRDEDPTGPFYFTIGTPVAESDDDPIPEACGRVVFTDLHVSKSDGGEVKDFSDEETPFPEGCTSTELSPQEKALEFMLFDLSSCVQQEASTPTTPPILK